MSETVTNINWFPGHMAKARREMSERINLVDLVIELRDARIPASSFNPVLSEITQKKPRLIVLTKKDKAIVSETEKWIAHFVREGYHALALDLLHDNVSQIISNACQDIMSEKIARLKARGMKRVEIKAMVVGIPNVGKSTLINSVSRKKMAKTSDKPGVTKNLQWIKVSPDVALLDTPGVLWPKFEDQKIGYKLALCSNIKDDVLPIDVVTRFGLKYLCDNYPEKVTDRYDVEMCDDVDELLERIATARHLLLNDAPDIERCEKLVLKEIRDGMLGRISWEKADENS